MLAQDAAIIWKQAYWGYISVHHYNDFEMVKQRWS